MKTEPSYLKYERRSIYMNKKQEQSESKDSPHLFRQISLEQGDAAELTLKMSCRKPWIEGKLPPWFSWRRHEKYSHPHPHPLKHNSRKKWKRGGARRTKRGNPVAATPSPLTLPSISSKIIFYHPTTDNGNHLRHVCAFSWQKCRLRRTKIGTLRSVA